MFVCFASIIILDLNINICSSLCAYVYVMPFVSAYEGGKIFENQSGKVKNQGRDKQRSNRLKEKRFLPPFF